MMRSMIVTVSLASLVLGGVACSASGESTDAADNHYSSNQATLLTFEFDGELTGSSGTFGGATSLINDQMLYTIGHLNGDRSVGRLDKLALTNVKTTTGSDGKSHVTYHAKLPVSWGSKTNLPSSYVLTLPRDASYEGQESFTSKYISSCVEPGAHDVDSGSMWYYYRPHLSSCHLDTADVFTTTATVTRSTENTTGKYPEYDRVWSDGTLKVVSIFGKFEEGATTDVGIDGFNRFVSSTRTLLQSNGLVTAPSSAFTAPGATDVTMTATLPNGFKVEVTALLVESITSASSSFWSRYETLSSSADMISYNGHAGLGQNVRALATHGTWVKGKYVIIFMNGCDTFAYVDGSLAQKRAAINPDDPTGTKYMEFVTNTMPSFFSSMPNASLSLVKGLMSTSAPKTYDQIFSGIDNSEVVLVTGEEDNTFTPGTPIGPTTGASDAGVPDSGTDAGPAPTGWTGLDESFTVAKDEEKRFTATGLAAGSYTFTLSGTGDADLYVKKGAAPSTTSYDCRPYRYGSNEVCTVTLTVVGEVDVLVRGWDRSSDVRVLGAKK
ncbi:MAG: PPC domain-containing protein [Polyangiaceae bacterium]